MKRCSCCEQELPLTEFHPNGTYKGVRQYRPECRECHREKVRQQRASETPEAKRARLDKHNARRAKNIEWRRQQARDWYARNRERVLADLQTDEKQERRRRWLAANPDKSRQYFWNRKGRLRGRGQHTEAEWEALVERCGYACLCCGETGVKLERDHVVPISAGGMNTIDNIQPLCRACNRRKGTQTIDYRDRTLLSEWWEERTGEVVPEILEP